MNRRYKEWIVVWKDILELVSEIRENGLEYDLVVGISRGGLVPAAMMARQLDLPMVSIHMEEGLEQFGDRRCLVVDDIFDSGCTMGLLWCSGGEQHTYMCLYDKDLHPEVQVPNFAVGLNTTDWVVFPWESEDDE